MAHIGHSSSTSPKAAHYNASLTAALLKGGWGDNNAGTAPNGTELSWGELVRKWGKHTDGNVDLIHRLRDISLLYLSSHSTSSSGFINVSSSSQSVIPAQTTSAGAPRAGASNSSDETTTTASTSSFIHIPHPHLHKHKSRPSGDTTRPSAQTSHASTGHEPRAAYLSGGDLDGDDLPDGTGWGIGNQWWKGVDSDDAEEAREGVKALEGLIAGGKLTPAELQSAKIILGYHLHALGSHEEALSVLDGVDFTSPSIGVVEGDAAVLDRIRAKLLQGMSAELQQVPNTRLALKSYVSIVPLVASLTSLSSPVPPYLALQSSSTLKLPFASHRELYRYLSVAFTRAAILSARVPNNNSETLQILRTYHNYSIFWPASFKPLQRQRMLQLYIRALYAGYPGPNTLAPTPYTLDTQMPTSSASAQALWRREAIEAIKAGRSLLAATTSFPRAGSVNAPVTQFCNLIVALADKSPAVQSSVIETLWWAMTLTFQSQSILRHLTRLQTSQGQITPAKRTFELYVQLVLKARETYRPESKLQLKRHSTEDRPARSKVAKEAEEENEGDGLTERQAETAETEMDTDEHFIEALLVGSRLLLRELRDAEDAWSYVSLAGDAVEAAELAKSPVPKSLHAQVEALKGTIRMAMGSRGADPIVRPKYQAQAIDHLVTSTKLNDNAALSFYHLAFCQAEARAIEPALASIRRSLELDSRNVQAWHLLALILTAQNDWDAAARAGEAGVSVWEQDDEKEISDEEQGADATVTSKDFAGEQQEATAQENEPLLLPSGNFHPPHIDSQPPASALTRAKRLENVIRLRMTLNVIAERTQGAEVAMLRQQELFAFFSARSGKNRYSGAGSGHYSRGLTGSTSFTSEPKERDLGGSYISINVDPVQPSIPQQGPLMSFQPPTPLEEHTMGNQNSAIVLGRPISASPGVSPGGSTVASETDSREDADSTSNEQRAGGRERKLRGTKRLVAKHLKVPRNGGSARSSRPSSVRRLHPPEDLGATVQRNRTASTSSAALSIAPTAVHSTFRSSNPAPPPPPPVQATANSEHTSAELRILSNLWLMSAATFRRWGKPEQSLVAIEEAEVLDPENPDVWVQLGLYHIAQFPPRYDLALPAFTKSILLKPDHPPGLVNLSKLYINTNQTELAHSLLNQMTQDSAWDVPEAWFYLGKVCEVQGRVERSRECWKYALELEGTRPARRWEDAVDRC